MDKFAIIPKTKIDEINAVGIDEDSSGRKIKTFLNIFYKMFPDFDEKETKRILVEDIPNEKVMEFLKAIVVFFPDVDVLGEGLNAKADQKCPYPTD